MSCHLLDKSKQKLGVALPAAICQWLVSVCPAVHFDAIIG